MNQLSNQPRFDIRCILYEFVNSGPNKLQISFWYSSPPRFSRMCLQATSALNSAFPTPSPLNGSTKLAASPTNKHPSACIILGWLSSFFLGLPKGNCQPFSLPGTNDAFSNRSLKIRWFSITSFCIAFSFLFCLFNSEITIPMPTFTIPLPNGNNQKYPGITLSTK